MDDEEDDLSYENETGAVVLPTRPLSLLDLVAFAFWATSQAADMVETVTSEFSDLLAMQIGYQMNRRELAERAAIEIEQMTGGQDG